MANVYPRIVLLILSMVALVRCYCPHDKTHNFGNCSFHVHCIGTIRGVRLPAHCQGSTNSPGKIQLELSEAIERFDPKINDKEFLRSVTTFRASGNWPVTALSILKYMTLLRNLYLAGNNIGRISGAPFDTLSLLANVDLSHNNLADIEDLFHFESYPNQLTKLSLAYNAIEHVTGMAFEELSSLIELDLSHNLISDLSDEPFTNLTSLEILRLNNNEIKDLNGALNNLRNLKHLHLRGNKIKSIDDPSLNVILHLETFDISGNQLNTLEPIILLRYWNHFGAGACKIIISGNHITFIPNGVDKERYTRESTDSKNHKVKVLTQLDLSNNAIKKIEKNAFRSIVQLISLDLSRNRLAYFDLNPKDVRHVQYLNLSCNDFTTLYFDNFSSMVKLQNLDLSHNKLNYLPDQTFTNNYNLKHVNMTFNSIRELEKLSIKMFHPEGGVLDLSKNGLARLYIPFDEGLHLTELHLQSNNITNPSFVKLIYQSQLTTLRMDSNHIRKLNASSLLLPLSLTSLNLEQNKIEEIGPSSFHRVSHLSSLFLPYNKLKSIEFGAFQGLSALSFLDLSFNKITYLDSKVLIDLKSLTYLSLRHNGLKNIDYYGWLGHKMNLNVYIDDNSLNCDWLSRALQDFNNGYSRMRPISTLKVTNSNTLEGIPCVQKERETLEKSGKLELAPHDVLADERLLVTNQKILEAVVEQTHYLAKIQNLMHKLYMGSSNHTGRQTLAIN